MAHSDFDHYTTDELSKLHDAIVSGIRDLVRGAAGVFTFLVAGSKGLQSLKIPRDFVGFGYAVALLIKSWLVNQS